jgi:hypothetical protein
MKGAPKQVEKVGVGSVMPRSVPGGLRGEAGQEVIHRLRRRQARDRRQHAEGVAGQHDDMFRMPAQPVAEAFEIASSG